MCTQIGVLLGKKLACIGSSQELKERYNLGFGINIKIRPKRRDEITHLKSQLQLRFNCAIEDASLVSFLQLFFIFLFFKYKNCTLLIIILGSNRTTFSKHKYKLVFHVQNYDRIKNSA